MYNIKFDREHNTVKLASKDVSFSNDAYPVTETEASLELLQYLLTHHEGIRVIVQCKNPKVTESLANSMGAIITTEPVKADVKPRNLENVKTVSKTEKKKWNSSHIPGQFAILRNEDTKLIYIGFRQHTYSYYNVLCVSDDVARKFMYDVAHTAASKENKTKSGKMLHSVDERDVGIHQYWMDYMDKAYMQGVAQYAE